MRIVVVGVPNAVVVDAAADAAVDESRKRHQQSYDRGKLIEAVGCEVQLTLDYAILQRLL